MKYFFIICYIFLLSKFGLTINNETISKIISSDIALDNEGTITLYRGIEKIAKLDLRNYFKTINQIFITPSDDVYIIGDNNSTLVYINKNQMSSISKIPGLRNTYRLDVSIDSEGILYLYDRELIVTIKDGQILGSINHGLKSIHDVHIDKYNNFIYIFGINQENKNVILPLNDGKIGDEIDTGHGLKSTCKHDSSYNGNLYFCERTEGGDVVVKVQCGKIIKKFNCGFIIESIRNGYIPVKNPDKTLSIFDIERECFLDPSAYNLDSFQDIKGPDRRGVMYLSGYAKNDIRCIALKDNKPLGRIYNLRCLSKNTLLGFGSDDTLYYEELGYSSDITDFIAIKDDGSRHELSYSYEAYIDITRINKPHLRGSLRKLYSDLLKNFNKQDFDKIMKIINLNISDMESNDHEYFYEFFQKLINRYIFNKEFVDMSYEYLEDLINSEKNPLRPYAAAILFDLIEGNIFIQRAGMTEINPEELKDENKLNTTIYAIDLLNIIQKSEIQTLKEKYKNYRALIENALKGLS